MSQSLQTSGGAELEIISERFNAYSTCRLVKLKVLHKNKITTIIVIYLSSRGKQGFKFCLELFAFVRNDRVRFELHAI